MVCSSFRIMRRCLFAVLSLVKFDKFLVFLQKNIPIFSSDNLRGRDIRAHGFQTGNDLISGLFIWLSADTIKFCHNLMEIDNRDLCSVNKPECTPANCRRVGINSGNSSYYLKNGHKALSSLFWPVQGTDFQLSRTCY